MAIERETINKLFLELSQFATATTEREMVLRDCLNRIDAALDKVHSHDWNGKTSKCRTCGIHQEVYDFVDGEHEDRDLDEAPPDAG